MDDATLLKKLAEYRETHNLTQAELANLLGVTRESLYRWLTGKVKLRASNKRIIKSILKSPAGVNINEFDRLTSELLSEWKCLGRSNRLKVLQYIEEIKTPEELKRQQTEQSKK
jgi:transcriptional regulator with XRE-family HTH domain